MGLIARQPKSSYLPPACMLRQHELRKLQRTLPQGCVARRMASHSERNTLCSLETVAAGRGTVATREACSADMLSLTAFGRTSGCRAAGDFSCNHTQLQMFRKLLASQNRASFRCKQHKLAIYDISSYRQCTYFRYTLCAQLQPYALPETAISRRLRLLVAIF